jgi:hypothetical protein
VSHTVSEKNARLQLEILLHLPWQLARSNPVVPSDYAAVSFARRICVDDSDVEVAFWSYDTALHPSIDENGIFGHEIVSSVSFNTSCFDLPWGICENKLAQVLRVPSIFSERASKNPAGQME